LRPISFRRVLAKPWRAVFGLSHRQRLARRIEAAEPLFHLVDLVADPLECGLEPQAIGREAVEMLEDADVRIGGGGLAGVDLPADQIERPLEARDLQERKVVGGIGVAAIKLVADDLLHPPDAEAF
jgi:hypothetical protein